MSLALKEATDAARIFNDLAKVRKKTMPFTEAFWGGKFGMLVDPFDLQWMVTSGYK